MDMNLLLKAVITVIALSVGLGSTFIFKMIKDNPIEQVAEEVIKEETGVTIDLTP